MPDLLKFTRTTLTGGGATAVDGISATALVGNELCWATVSDVEYLYKLNPTSGAAADGVNIIIPVVGTVGNKRWILQSIYGNITFPATQVPSADANTLDDYEEGTWTPSVGGNATYDGVNGGTYTKIGRQVFFEGRLTITLIGTGSVTTMSGLPFVCGNAGSVPFPVYFSNLNVTTISLVGMVDSGAQTCKFYGLSAAAASLGAALSVMKNDTDLLFAGHYKV